MRYTTFCLVRSKWLNEVQGWNRDLRHPARPRLVKRRLYKICFQSRRTVNPKTDVVRLPIAGGHVLGRLPVWTPLPFGRVRPSLERTNVDCSPPASAQRVNQKSHGPCAGMHYFELWFRKRVEVGAMFRRPCRIAGWLRFEAAQSFEAYLCNSREVL